MFKSKYIFIPIIDCLQSHCVSGCQGSSRCLDVGARRRACTPKRLPQDSLVKPPSCTETLLSDLQLVPVKSYSWDPNLFPVFDPACLTTLLSVILTPACLVTTLTSTLFDILLPNLACLLTILCLSLYLLDHLLPNPACLTTLPASPQFCTYLLPVCISWADYTSS